MYTNECIAIIILATFLISIPVIADKNTPPSTIENTAVPGNVTVYFLPKQTDNGGRVTIEFIPNQSTYAYFRDIIESHTPIDVPHLPPDTVTTNPTPNPPTYDWSYFKDEPHSECITVSSIQSAHGVYYYVHVFDPMSGPILTMTGATGDAGELLNNTTYTGV